MKTLQRTLLALVAGSLMTAGAQAAINYGGMSAQPYIGAKIGQYDVDGVDNEALSYGVYGGAKFTPNFGVEAEYLTTGDEDVNNVSEYSADVYGLYATYDYMFPTMNGMYAKARLGMAKNEVDVDSKVATVADMSYDNSGIAGGIGLGYNFAPNAAVEVAYDWYPSIDDNAGTESDSNGITLGANFKF